MNRAISVGVNSLNSSKITDLSGDMLPPSPGALISGLALQPLAVPANEIDERPPLVLVIRASGKMLRLGPLDLRVTEISRGEPPPPTGSPASSLGGRCAATVRAALTIRPCAD